MNAALRAGRRPAVATQSATSPVTLGDLPLAESHRLTNRLYSVPGVRANGLVWYWQAVCPSRIEEWVTLAADDARICVAFDGDAIGLHTDPFEWRSYDADTRLLAWTARHEPLIELLRAIFRRDWVPESLGDCDAPAQASCMRAGFAVYRDDHSCVVTGTADFDPACVDMLAAEIASCVRRAIPALHRVHARLPLVLDEVETTRAELGAISHGCIVRLDNRTLTTERARVAIRAGSTRVIVDVNQLQATVVAFAAPSIDLQPATVGGTSMNDDRPTTSGAPAGSRAATAAQGIDAGTLPVRLNFSAGRLILPFGALADVAPGYVFELDKRLDDQSITIHANDVPIALGELVCVGDLVGVRITRMLSRT